MSKNYLIVGGSSGIGKEIATQLLKEGNRVIILSRNPENFDQKGDVTRITADVVNDELSDLELPETLDGVVYAPGSINLRPFRGLKLEDFTNDIEVNFMGAVKILKAAYKPLLKSENGSVVLFSTVAVQQGMPFHSSIASAKGAVEGLTRSLAAEWAPKIRVNCIAPSLTDTPLAEKLLSTPQKQEASAQRHPLSRYGKPEDIANMAVFLLSGKTGWITGQILGVDGGMSSLKA
jgi:NAD(P)-dependent dehydrogenase (short-subunit alcohol dehydrogenase family)